MTLPMVTNCSLLRAGSVGSCGGRAPPPAAPALPSAAASQLLGDLAGQGEDVGAPAPGRAHDGDAAGLLFEVGLDGAEDHLSPRLLGGAPHVLVVVLAH